MGEVFAGRYELVDPIGRGGVGEVWRAWDHRRRRYVAAKILLQSDAYALLRFVREQALRIDHPHVLAPASWAADDDKVLFTMDLVGGGSLARLIGDYGPLPPRYVALLLDQLLSGLSAVHAEGVVHRDIKPANILLEATGTGRPHLRLSDFGIALRKGDPRLTRTDLVVGTPGYIAPEQYDYDEPDFPADLFATGLVALCLLEGAKPDTEALLELFRSQGTPHAPRTIPEPLWQVLAGLLQPEPHARFRSATGARKALAEATALLPEPGPDDELIEIFDQLGPLPSPFGPDGPLPPPTTPTPTPTTSTPTAPPPAASIPVTPAPATPTTSAPIPAPPAPATPTPATPTPAVSGDFTTATPSTAQHPAAPPSAAPPPGPPAPPGAPPAPFIADTATGPPFPHAAPTPAPPTTPPPHTPTGPAHQAQVEAWPPESTPRGGSAPDTPAAHPAHPNAQAEPAHAAPAPGAPTPHADALHAGPQPAHPTPRHITPHAATAPDNTPAAPSSHRRPRPGRSGPPVKVAVPVLLLAALCFAVGFWALGQI
ncbi:serine/threonine-protein kinase [Streptomyces sp. KLOTTS4A1]|uniref:serine/threonine-protein kinase n=1 Tax=Streptomyces sp. KLOTTS4A1 TaxID=3390996 RepID=UPI0039F5302E